MSLWVCPEHGLYGGDVFCPMCGENGYYAEIEPTHYGESPVETVWRSIDEATAAWRRAMDRIALRRKPMKSIDISITAIGNGVLVRADFGYCRSEGASDRDQYFPTPEAAFAGLPELAAAAWADMIDRQPRHGNPLGQSSAEREEGLRTHAGRPDDEDRALGESLEHSDDGRRYEIGKGFVGGDGDSFQVGGTAGINLTGSDMPLRNSESED